MSERMAAENNNEQKVNKNNEENVDLINYKGIYFGDENEKF